MVHFSSNTTSMHFLPSNFCKIVLRGTFLSNATVAILEACFVAKWPNERPCVESFISVATFFLPANSDFHFLWLALVRPLSPGRTSSSIQCLPFYVRKIVLGGTFLPNLNRATFSITSDNFTFLAVLQCFINEPCLPSNFASWVFRGTKAHASGTPVKEIPE